MLNLKEYEEGRNAFENGEDYTDNPYPQKTTEANKWDHGWDDAEEDDQCWEDNEL